MRKKTFENLKEGDRVLCNYGSEATVMIPKCNHGSTVKLKCDNPKWSCPFFYRSEIKKKLRKSG